MSDKRTVKETIELFKNYAYHFEMEAHRCSDKETAARESGSL